MIVCIGLKLWSLKQNFKANLQVSFQAKCSVSFEKHKKEFLGKFKHGNGHRCFTKVMVNAWVSKFILEIWRKWKVYQDGPHIPRNFCLIEMLPPYFWKRTFEISRQFCTTYSDVFMDSKYYWWIFTESTYYWSSWGTKSHVTFVMYQFGLNLGWRYVLSFLILALCPEKNFSHLLFLVGGQHVASCN